MRKRQKTYRLIVSGCLLAAVLLTGITVYQVETSQIDRAPDSVTVTPKPKVSASSGQTADTEKPTEAPADAQTGASVESLPTLDFTEETLLTWPLDGSNILMDYSMDHTVYFDTLDVYKYNPALIISAAVDTPVAAVANSCVASITENEETGTTVTMDMGNGYQAIYGQLANVSVAEGDTIEAGTVIGAVATPTKYYTVEGSNLYFEMMKDAAVIDPVLYLP